MADDVLLKIDGEVHQGWTEIRVTRTMNALCASFDLSLTERWPDAPDRRAIRDQAACELWVGAERLITGYLFDVNKSLDAGSHSVSASGRDRTADIIDCSAVHKPGSWKGQKLERIVADLLRPFGLQLVVKASTGAAFAAFALEPGESVFEAITRLCRMRGLLVGTDTEARVVLFKPQPVLAGYSLELGRNVWRISTRSSSAARFSSYTLKGQHTAAGKVAAKDASAPKGSAQDKGVTRYRPLIIISNEQSTLNGLQTRAAYEATMHMANALSVDIEVRGWRDDTGALYAPQTFVPVRAALLDVDMTLLINEVTFNLSESGRSTTLKLTRPEAFTTEAILEPKKIKTKKGKQVDLLPMLE